jgi:hypothetical protein
VAGAIRAARPGLRLVVCGDNDHATAGNPGGTRARETAAAPLSHEAEAATGAYGLTEPSVLLKHAFPGALGAWHA